MLLHVKSLVNFTQIWDTVKLVYHGKTLEKQCSSPLST